MGWIMLKDDLASFISHPKRAHNGLPLLAADGFVLDAFDRHSAVKPSRCRSTLMIWTPLLLAAVTVAGLVLPLFGCAMKRSG